MEKNVLPALDRGVELPDAGKAARPSGPGRRAAPPAAAAARRGAALRPEGSPAAREGLRPARLRSAQVSGRRARRAAGPAAPAAAAGEALRDRSSRVRASSRAPAPPAQRALPGPPKPFAHSRPAGCRLPFGARLCPGERQALRPLPPPAGRRAAFFACGRRQGPPPGRRQPGFGAAACGAFCFAPAFPPGHRPLLSWAARGLACRRRLGRGSAAARLGGRRLPGVSHAGLSLPRSLLTQRVRRAFLLSFMLVSPKLSASQISALLDVGRLAALFGRYGFNHLGFPRVRSCLWSCSCAHLPPPFSRAQGLPDRPSFAARAFGIDAAFDGHPLGAHLSHRHVNPAGPAKHRSHLPSRLPSAAGGQAFCAQAALWCPWRRGSEAAPFSPVENEGVELRGVSEGPVFQAGQRFGPHGRAVVGQRGGGVDPKRKSSFQPQFPSSSRCKKSQRLNWT